MVTVVRFEQKGVLYCLATTRKIGEGSHMSVTSGELTPLLNNGVLKLSIKVKYKLVIIMGTKIVSHSNVQHLPRYI